MASYYLRPSEDTMNQKAPTTLFETIGQYLLDADRNLEVIPDSGYIGTMGGDHMSWKIMVRIDDDSELRRIQVNSLFANKCTGLGKK